MPRNRLRELRKHVGISQAELARQIGVSAYKIHRWETGQTKLGSADEDVIAALADVLRVSVPFLMGWNDGNGNNDEVAA